MVSILGNHDKYSKKSHEVFCQYICNGKMITPKNPAKVRKNKIYFHPAHVRLN